MEYWDHTMGPQERVALRAIAVQAVRDGERKSHVARRLGVTRQTLHNWLIKHRLGGTDALAAKPRGRTGRGLAADNEGARALLWDDNQTTGAATMERG